MHADRGSETRHPDETFDRYACGESWVTGAKAEIEAEFFCVVRPSLDERWLHQDPAHRCCGAT